MTAKTQLRAGVYGRESRGKTKSISDQLALGHELCAGQGWSQTAYSDTTSASWFGTKPRGGWEDVLTDVAAGELDVLVLWEASRGDRRLTEWSKLLDTCQAKGVLIHVVSHERTYDLRIGRDWETLASEGVRSQSEANQISIRSKRGAARAAKDGRPPMGPCPYGYRRTYDPGSGDLAGQEPDPVTAGVVAQIVARVGAGVPLSDIARDLNARGVPPPGVKSKRWHRQRVREIALSPAYAGKRLHRAKGAYRGERGELSDGSWAAVVSPAAHRAAVKVLTDPGRIVHGNTSSRPGRQRHLLSWLAECYRGHPLVAYRGFLRCRQGCVQVDRAELDDLVRVVICGALAAPQLYVWLRQASEVTDARVAAAAGELAQLQALLDDWRVSAVDGRGTTPGTLAAVEAGLAPRIEAARRRADVVGLPPVLAGFAGPGVDVDARWGAATLQARRDVIRALARVVVNPAPRRGVRTPVADRVDVVPVWVTPTA